MTLSTSVLPAATEIESSEFSINLARLYLCESKLEICFRHFYSKDLMLLLSSTHLFSDRGAGDKADGKGCGS